MLLLSMLDGLADPYCLLMPLSRLSAGLRRLLAINIPALLGLQSTVWDDSHMLPNRGVRVWVVYLTPKIERIIVLPRG
jgi:hypothetical protein